MMTEEQHDLVDFINQEIDKWDDERRYVRVLEIALAALTQPASPALKLPDGWVAVPLEPSREMRLASKRYKSKTKLPTGPGVYRAMLKAAPSIPHTAPIEPTGGAEWVKCSERMPLELSDEDIREVEVIVTDGNTVGTCEYRRGYLPRPWAKWSNYGDIDADKITHWQPMPSVPDA